MPIQVRELVIKASVQQETGGQAKPGTAGTNNSVGPNEELVQACLDKLAEIIKTRYER